MQNDGNNIFTQYSAGLANRRTVLNYIRAHQGITRTDIWENLSLARPTVTQIIRQMIESGLVIETEAGVSRGGRKPIVLQLNEKHKRMLAYNWHGNGLFLTDLSGRVLAHRTLRVEKKGDPSRFIETLADEIARFCADNALSAKDILGMGLSLAGLINSDEGTIVYCTVNDWRDVPVARLLSGRTGIDVFAESDMFAETLGEYRFWADSRHRMTVSIAAEQDGIGMVAISDNRMLKGANFMSGEIGHISLDPDGLLCECGRRGCIEVYYKKALSEGNEAEVLRLLAMAASVAVNLYDPSLILCMGSVMDALGDDTFASLKDMIRSGALNGEKRSLELKRSRSRDSAAVIGLNDIVFNKNCDKLFE